MGYGYLAQEFESPSWVAFDSALTTLRATGLLHLRMGGGRRIQRIDLDQAGRQIAAEEDLRPARGVCERRPDQGKRRRVNE